ncbi:MAG TPA: efflux RND transporter periplasmic adaptor subunit [Dissulfurispiraceae bacterium]|nr:efflux RND transporter periplasmic adaptor subunit [Dissulfurispiraceae bacterium]
MKKRISIIIIAAILLLGGMFIFTRLGKESEPGVILLSGNVEVTEVDIGFKIGGRVTELLTDEGRKVEKDQKLAALDKAELESLVAQNKAAVSEAASRLMELKTGSRPQEIAQALANKKALEAELERTSKDFERAKRLFKSEAISVQQLDAARSAYDSRAEQVRAAAEQLSIVREGPRKEVVKAAEDRLQQARAGLQIAEERLGDSILYAPSAGVILKKNVELGEIVQSGASVFKIGEIDDPWVKVYVKEDKLGLVKLGQKADITVDTYKGKIYDGTVSYISSEAEFTPKTVQTQDERVKLVFGVKVKVKNINQELKPGMPADVKIHIK